MRAGGDEEVSFEELLRFLRLLSDKEAALLLHYAASVWPRRPQFMELLYDELLTF